MRSTVTFPLWRIDTNPLLWFTVLVGTAYAVISFVAMRDLFIGDVNVYLALAMLPYAVTIQRGVRSWRYLVPNLVFAAITMAVPVKTFYFLAVVFAVLFFIETMWGKTNYAVLMLVLLASAVFKYVNGLVGFPVRLWLSEVAGSVLALTGTDTSVAGNLIEFGGESFTVDAACVGLKMVATAFIMAVFAVAHRRRTTGKTLPLWTFAGFLLFAFGLNVVCNLLRIVLLVLLNVPPENAMHDVIGLLCFGVYVVVPLVFVSGKLFQHFAVVKTQSETSSTKTGKAAWWTNGLLALFIVIVGTQVNADSSDAMFEKATHNLPGFNGQRMNDGVYKYESANALVYVKQLLVYRTEHSPTACWAGSGYEFEQVNKEPVAGVPVYTATLRKEADVIYAAWWYDNGTHKTIDPVEWRWRAARGDKPYSLVNVNAANREVLFAEVEQLNQTDIFNATTGLHDTAPREGTTAQTD